MTELRTRNRFKPRKDVMQMKNSTTSVPALLTAAGLRGLYLSGALTPETVAREIVRRAQEDAAMHIWIEPPEMARIAPYLEKLQAMDPERFPLWGIPFAVKDNIDVAGYPTTAGCPDYAYKPAEHSAVVQALVDAGAIPVGKANLDQFATGLVGTRSPYGETSNALRPELISGGSSSGSAVAVARGQAAFALGTDTAGSGRVPAALNRLVGWKPSLGAWSVRGMVPASASIDCVTAFTHTLEDALAVDLVARGYDAADCWSRRLPEPAAPRTPARLLLPQQTDLFYGPFAAEYEAAWDKAVSRLESLGIPVERIDTSLFAEAASILYEGPWVAERWAGLGAFVDGHPGSTLPVTEQILRSGAGGRYDAASVFAAMHSLQRFRTLSAGLLQDAVLVMPTCGGTWSREEVRRDPVTTNRDMGRYTNHCNLLELCAIAVPADDAADRLPFGITMFAPDGEESLLAAAGSVFAGGRARTAADEPDDNAGHRSAGDAAAEQQDKTGRQDGAPLAGPVPQRAAMTQVAVCGLHMRGYPLEKQMLASGARFLRETETAKKYKLAKLATVPPKPGLIKLTDGGAAVRLEVWEMPLASFGEFAAGIPAPLGIGKVELADGTEVPGFVCEGYAAETGEDITGYGGWRAAMPLQPAQ